MEMKGFNSEVWAMNPLKKVVTRDGREVRILSVKYPDKCFPVIGYIVSNGFVFTWSANGDSKEHETSMDDIFFVEDGNPPGWCDVDVMIFGDIVNHLGFEGYNGWIDFLRRKLEAADWHPTEEQKTALWNAIGFIRHRVQYDWSSKNGSINGMDYPVMLKLLESIYEGIKNK